VYLNKKGLFATEAESMLVVKAPFAPSSLYPVMGQPPSLYGCVQRSVLELEVDVTTEETLLHYTHYLWLIKSF